MPSVSDRSPLGQLHPVSLVPDPTQLHLLGLAGDASGISAPVTTMSPHACCPVCRQPSSRVHSR
jgi:hypothetical protein